MAMGYRQCGKRLCRQHCLRDTSLQYPQPRKRPESRHRACRPDRASGAYEPEREPPRQRVVSRQAIRSNRLARAQSLSPYPSPSLDRIRAMRLFAAALRCFALNRLRRFRRSGRCRYRSCAFDHPCSLQAAGTPASAKICEHIFDGHAAWSTKKSPCRCACSMRRQANSK
jgi:hypothetical protein